MKVRLCVQEERYEDIRSLLNQHGIEVDDDGELVLSESGAFARHLMVKAPASNERVILPVEEIFYIEACGHTVEVHTEQVVYHAYDRLYRLHSQLDPEQFLRISNSVVIAKKQVRRITPTLSMKFILTMEDGKKVDVTRSYYYSFKEAFGI